MAKVEGTVRSFRGKEDENLDEFWQKFQVVAKIQKLTTGEDRMHYLPLYLSGDAFTVWSSMSEADKKDEDKVVARLRESFQASAGEAYTQFVKRKKRGDETVDAYLADLRRLMATSGHKEAADGKDPMLMAQLLAGLPTKFANQQIIGPTSALQTLHARRTVAAATYMYKLKF